MVQSTTRAIYFPKRTPKGRTEIVLGGSPPLLFDTYPPIRHLYRGLILPPVDLILPGHMILGEIVEDKAGAVSHDSCVFLVYCYDALINMTHWCIVLIHFFVGVNFALIHVYLIQYSLNIYFVFGHPEVLLGSFP